MAIHKVTVPTTPITIRQSYTHTVFTTVFEDVALVVRSEGARIGHRAHGYVSHIDSQQRASRLELRLPKLPTFGVRWDLTERAWLDDNGDAWNVRLYER